MLVHYDSIAAQSRSDLFPEFAALGWTKERNQFLNTCDALKAIVWPCTLGSAHISEAERPTVGTDHDIITNR